MNCKTCRFFAVLNERGGYCHRYPPQLIFETYDLSSNVAQYFPYMEFDEWCGEHKEISMTDEPSESSQ